MIKSLLKNKN